MRVKKRVKRGVKKGIKRVKSAPPEAYIAGVGVLVGGAAVLLLATTKTGQELLLRTAQLALRSDADEQDESDEEEGEQSEPGPAAEAEEEPEEDTARDADSEVTNLKPRSRAPAVRHAANA